MGLIERIGITETEKTRQEKTIIEIKELIDIYKPGENLKKGFPVFTHSILERIENFDKVNMNYNMPRPLLAKILQCSCDTEEKILRMEKKLDTRSLEYLIWYLVCGKIYENILQVTLSQLLEVELEKSGSDGIQLDMTKVLPDEDFTYKHNGKIRKLEVQRVNYFHYGKPIEIKYHKKDADVILCFLTEGNVIKVLLIDPKKERSKMFYTNYLPYSHKKGFTLPGIKEEDFIELKEENKNQLQSYFYEYLA